MRAQSRDVRVQQNSVNKSPANPSVKIPFFAEVTDAMSDRMACHIKTVDGYELNNVPVLVNGGLVDGAPYGERSLPSIGDWVLVMFAGKYERMEVIVGTVVPYLTSEFQADAVNSTNKAFSLKLIEADKRLSDLKIFKSGTTFEVDENGSVVLETPSGTYVQIDEANDKVVVEDQHGNKFTLDSDGVEIDDTNGNNITMSSTGMKLIDKNSKDITMTSAGVSVNNGNLEVL